MRRHLPPVRIRIKLRADRRTEHFLRRHSESEHQSAVAVIREKPIIRGLHRQRGGGQNGFVSRARNLEKNLVLTFELNFLVVNPAATYTSCDTF